MRRLVPVNYDEKEKKKPIRRNRPQTEYAKVKGNIFATIEQISELNQALCIHNRLKDKISIADVSEIEDLLDDSDSEDEMHPIVEIEVESDPNGQVDKEFSLEYSYTTDVSGM